MVPFTHSRCLYKPSSIPSLSPYPTSSQSSIYHHHHPNPNQSNFQSIQTLHHLNHFPPSTKNPKMKSQLLIAFLPLFLTAALAVPAAKPQSSTNPVEVCTQATDGDPCIVVEVDGSRLAGRCIFDEASRSLDFSPPSLALWKGKERESANRAEQLLPSGSICLLE